MEQFIQAYGVTALDLGLFAWSLTLRSVLDIKDPVFDYHETDDGGVLEHSGRQFVSEIGRWEKLAVHSAAGVIAKMREGDRIDEGSTLKIPVDRLSSRLDLKDKQITENSASIGVRPFLIQKKIQPLTKMITSTSYGSNSLPWMESLYAFR